MYVGFCMRESVSRLCVCSCAQKATAKGVTFVRVVVKGLGPGRLVSTRAKYVTVTTV